MSDTLTATRFFAVTELLLRDLVYASIGQRFDGQPIVSPSQGVNNNTYLLGSPGSGGVVVKLRPISGHGEPIEGPYWPDFTRALWGSTPNGDIRTLEDVSGLLQAKGSLRVPRVLQVDHSLEPLPAPFTITELLAGEPFDWNEGNMEETAARDLGDHLGHLHASTNVEGFGIFSGPLQPASAWWSRFGQAYGMLLKRLVEASPQLESVVPSLLAAFDRAVSAGEPRHCALICLDQAPSHYLRAQGGGISAMIDIEGHLWAPVEYELAIVSLWMRPFETVKAAYEEHVAWPSAFDEVSDVYRNFTWMQWIYCMRFLTPNPTVVEGLEKQLMQMCS